MQEFQWTISITQVACWKMQGTRSRSGQHLILFQLYIWSIEIALVINAFKKGMAK